MRTYVAVDGGMSDNLRPMLYGSRYEALIADRAAEPPDDHGDDRRHALRVGRHAVRDARLAAPARRRRARHPGDRRLRLRDGQQLQRRPAPAGGLLLATATPGVVVRRETYDDLRGAGCRMRPEPVAHRPARAGAPSAAPSPTWSPSAPTRSRPPPGAGPRSPACCAAPRATSTRSSSAREIVVELIGGTDPARDYVLARAARGPPRRHRQQAAGRPARRRALRGRARGRRPAALRGGGRRGRPGDPGDPGEPRRDRDHQGLRDRQRDDQLHPHRDGERPAPPTPTSLARAQELGYAEADPTDDVDGADAAAKMAILARLAFHTPVELDDVTYEGIDRDPARRPRLREGARPLAEAARRRRAPRAAGSASASSPASSTAATRWPRSRARSTRSWSRRRRSPRSRCRARAPAASRPRPRCSATSSRSSPARRRCTRSGAQLRDGPRRLLVLLPAPRGRRPARACWRGSPTCSAATRSRSRASSSAGSATTRAW